MDNPTCPYSAKDSEDLKHLNTMPRFIQAGLLYFKKYANVRRQGFGQRMAVCELLKARGNEFFGQGDIEAAIKEYEQAVSIFRYIVDNGITSKNENAIPENVEKIDFAGEDQKEKNAVRNIKVALYNNLAACYLKAQDYKNAKFSCDEVLVLDSNQAKALYRRAKAITLAPNPDLEDYNLALEDAKKANSLSPQDGTILQTLNQIRQEISRLKSRPEAFKGIFSQKNEKVKSSLSYLKGDNEEYNDSVVSTQAKSEESLDLLLNETPPNKKKYSEDSQTLNECYENLSKSNLESQSTFNQEIGKMGKILEAKRHEISETVDKVKGCTVTKGLKEHLDKAMTALHRLEELGSLDLTNPNRLSKDAVKKFGLNMNGPSLVEELKRIQTRSLEEIKVFIDELSLNDKNLNQTESTPNLNQKENSQELSKSKNYDSIKPMTNKTTNNYFINNNYFSETDSLYDEFSRLSERIRTADGFKNNKGKPGPQTMADHQMLNDLAKEFSKLKRPEKRPKHVKTMNIVIIVVAVILFLATVLIQAGNPGEVGDM